MKTWLFRYFHFLLRTKFYIELDGCIYHIVDPFRYYIQSLIGFCDSSLLLLNIELMSDLSNSNVSLEESPPPKNKNKTQIQL